jgi:hypothetical protein
MDLVTSQYIVKKLRRCAGVKGKAVLSVVRREYFVTSEQITFGSVEGNLMNRGEVPTRRPRPLRSLSFGHILFSQQNVCVNHGLLF